MKKYLAVFVAALAFSCGPAFSQPVAALDPAAVEATQQLLKAIKARELMLSSMRQMEQRMPEQIRGFVSGVVQNNANLNAQQKQELLARVDKTIPAMVAQLHDVIYDPAIIDEVMAEMVPMYAETFSGDEIHQLTAFYLTPLGQKMLANTPKIAARSMEMSNRIIMPKVQKIMAQMATSLAE